MKTISVVMLAILLFWSAPRWLLTVHAQSIRTVEWIWPDSLKGQQVNVKCLLVRRDTIYAGTTGSGTYLLLSPDKGQSWVQLGPAQGLYSAFGSVWTIVETKSGDLLAGTNDGLFRSTNRGKSWVQELFNKRVITLLVVHDGTIFAGSHQLGIQRSRDNGQTWQEVLKSASIIPPAHISAMVETAYGVILAGTFNSTPNGTPGIFRSTNQGDTWTVVGNGQGLAHTNTEGLAAYPYGAFTQRVYATTYLGGAFMSDDDGATWSKITAIPEYAGRGAAVIEPMGAFLGFADSRTKNSLYRSYGSSGWLPVPEMMGYGVLSITQFSSHEIVLGTNDGVWLVTFESTFMEPGPRVPTAYALLQNYPNPFNPSTTIEFALPHRDFVKLSVSNIIGQEVAVLVNEEKGAGYHRVVWDAEVLPSGIYFYRLETNYRGSTSIVAVKKMLLVK
jgi:hypothetical protein